MSFNNNAVYIAKWKSGNTFIWLNHFHLGASIPCCQGTNPVPQADAICGWWFQIDPKDERGAHAAICGKYTYNDIFKKIFFLNGKGFSLF